MVRDGVLKLRADFAWTTVYFAKGLVIVRECAILMAAWTLLMEGVQVRFVED